jgi:hypothetical protein
MGSREVLDLRVRPMECDTPDLGCGRPPGHQHTASQNSTNETQHADGKK